MAGDPLLAGLGVVGDEDDSSSDADDTAGDTDAMAAERVADDFEAGMNGDRAALLRAIRVLMGR